MKAFLQEKNAAGVWGHDLEALRTKVQAHGCPLSLDETEAGHFNLINNVFGKTPYEVRYLVTGFSSVHDDAIISKIAFRFALEVAQHIPGSVRRPTSGSRV